jgi:L,D-transpeptidase YcbB
MKFTSKAALLAAATSLVLAAQPQGAYAQKTLFDLLFGNKQNAVQQNSAPGMPNTPSSAAIDATDPDPLPHVKAPQYYTYKAEAQRLIKVPALAGPVVTGALSTDTNMPADASAQPVMISIRAENSVANAIEAFYVKNDNYIWITADGINDRARSAMGALAKAGDFGLNPDDYKVAEPEHSDDPAVMRQNLMNFEIGLSKAVLTFVQDDVRGRIDPNRIAEYYDFKRKEVNLKGALMVISHSPDVAAYLDSRAPSNAEFAALKAELAKLRATQTDTAPRVEIAPGTLLKPGMSDPQLVNVIEAIKQRGSDAFKTDHAVTLADYQGTLDYTPELVSLVEDFQKENGLKADGVIGKGTIRLLSGGDSQGSKIDKVIAAMEELRWLPNDLGARRVFINQPAFMAYYYSDNQQQLAMRVVVGQPGHQTFFFQNQIQTVEFNPYWGVPHSIIVNEMLPKLRQDPSYLDRLGYQVSIRGKDVASSSIDWAHTDNVDVRQPPGSDNALGELKILFPNAHAIYMHDTPSKSFFKRDMRALSHGCVRLQDPRGMAAAVLGVSRDQIAENIATGKNMSVSVPQKIPVYVAYFTAWPDKDGAINYYDDVYGRDMYLQRAFDTTSKSRAQS